MKGYLFGLIHGTLLVLFWTLAIVNFVSYGLPIVFTVSTIISWVLILAINF